MTAAPKTFLAVSVIGFAVGGVVDFGSFSVNPTWTVAMPVGAIAFGLFLISFMMEKEMAMFDMEEAKKKQSVQCNPPVPEPHASAQSTVVQLKKMTL